MSFVTDVHRVRLLQRSFLNSDWTGLTKSRASVAEPPVSLTGFGKSLWFRPGGGHDANPRSAQHDRSMVIRDDEDEAAAETGCLFRKKSNPTESEVHGMNTKPSSMHPPTEDLNGEPREAR